MLIELLITIIFGTWLFVLGQRIGRIMLRYGASGKLDPQTVLSLSGSFLEGVPTLKKFLMRNFSK